MTQNNIVNIRDCLHHIQASVRYSPTTTNLEGRVSYAPVYKTHIHITGSAVAQRCVKSDTSSQWERSKFDPYRIESIEAITKIFGTGD